MLCGWKKNSAVDWPCSLLISIFFSGQRGDAGNYEEVGGKNSADMRIPGSGILTATGTTGS